MTQDKQLKLNHEKVLRLLHQNAYSTLSAFDEPIAIAFAVVWQSQLGEELPFGGVAYKPDTQLTPQLISDCLRQSNKLSAYLVNSLGEWGKAASSHLQTIAMLQERVAQLEKQVQQKEAKDI